MLWDEREVQKRPPSQSQRKDMVVLAHIRDQFRLSLGSYGRLMRENGNAVKKNGTFKAATDNNHSFYIAPHLLNRDFSAARPTGNERVTSAIFGHRRAGFIWRSWLICTPGASSARRSATE